MQPENNKPLPIKATDEDLKGNYANTMQIMTGPEEFILDFFNAFPPTGMLVSRVILSPGHLKRMLSVLDTTLKQYEKQFGSVEAAAEPEKKIGFQPTTN